MKNPTISTLNLLDQLKEKELISDREYDILSKDQIKYSESSKPPSWQEVRNMFFNENENEKKFEVEPMNAANLCPTFFDTLNQIHQFRSRFNQDISIQKRRRKFSTILSYTKHLVARQLGVEDVKNLAFIRNTSEGNNQLSRGFNRWEGGEVLLWDENHPTNFGAWYLRSSATKGVEKFSLKDLDFDKPDHEVEEDILNIIMGKINVKTRLLSFTEVSNVSGIKMPAKAIIESVRSYEKNELRRHKSEIHIHVDGAMSWGAIAHNLVELDCDSFASSAHKWLMGPFETGIFYMKKERAKDFDISIYSYDGKVEIPPIHGIYEDARRFELLGQRDDANLYSLYSTIARHNYVNRDKDGLHKNSRIQNRIIYLQNYLRNQLLRISGDERFSLTYLTPRSPKFSNGVTIFQIAFHKSIIDHKALNDYLYSNKNNGRRYAVADAGGGNYLRICPHIMNMESNIRQVVDDILVFLQRYPSMDKVNSLQESSIFDWPHNPYSVQLEENMV